MRKCWHELLLSMAWFWRSLSLLLFGAGIFGAVIVNFPGKPVLIGEVGWLVAGGVVLFIVHLILLSLAHIRKVEERSS